MATSDFEQLPEARRQALDALLSHQDSARWNSFYADRARPCPFFGTAPDESLDEWIRDGRLRPGRAIDLGCGNARNAIHLARHGFSVEAVDYSEEAIRWAGERVGQAHAQVTLIRDNVLALNLQAGAYDLVYDSGCFHHIAPHRRAQYVERVVHALKPGAAFAMTCFRPEGGSGWSDDEVYERGSLGGGLGYTEAQLRQIWSRGLQVRVLRQMREPGAGSGLFGESFLWVMLAHRV